MIGRALSLALFWLAVTTMVITVYGMVAAVLHAGEIATWIFISLVIVLVVTFVSKIFLDTSEPPKL